MQDGTTPVCKASLHGHSETVALLLVNKADINTANNVHQFKIFKYLLVIDNELEDFNFAFSYYQ
jgi:ankyrin repeat protein